MVTGAASAPGTQASDMYARGDYESAIRFGLASGTSENLAIAARAALSDAKSREQPCAECFRRAEAIAERAIAADPHNADLYVYLASALGGESHILGTLATTGSGIPGKAKRAIDAALVIAPDNAYALAALGGWNMEVVRIAGAIAGKLFYSASFNLGTSAFERALKLAPNNIIIHYEYALELASYDANAQKAKITSELEAAISAHGETAYEQLLQMRARNLSQLLSSKEHGPFVALVRRYQYFSQ